jgi:bzd-type benzoyl-CoA reductase N subunit
MKQVDECREILKDPDGYVRSLKAQSGVKIVGTFCSYAPEEMVLAAGAHPYRLFGSGQKVQLAEAHLQSYCCSLVRGALEDALAGRLGFLDGVVFPHTCDSIQRLSDIWRLNIPGCFHLDAVLPVKLDTEGARQYMIAVLSRLQAELGEKLGKTISDDDLRGAIGTMNRIRASLSRIDGLRSEQPELLPGSDFHALVRASMVLERGRAAQLLEEVAAELEKAKGGGSAPGPAKKRILLSGGVCNHPDLYEVIEAAGGAVVGDDLCTGSRYFGGLIDETAEPVAAIAERYRERVVCPAKHKGLTDRADQLVGLVRQRRARGVIFFLLKFCDPHAFDYPCLREALEKQGIPSLLMEVEDRLPADGQLRTRFEAFIEMI